MSGMVDALFSRMADFAEHQREQRPTPARDVSIQEMRRWVQASLADRKRRAERQLAKDIKRTTPAKAARSVEVGEALIALLREIELRPGA